MSSDASFLKIFTTIIPLFEEDEMDKNIVLDYNRKRVMPG